MKRRPTGAGSNPAMLLGIAAVLLAAVTVYCGSPESRHEVLSFFFDGVPDPNAEPAGGGEGGGPATGPREEGPPPGGSVHKPVAEGRCNVCHGESFGRPGAWRSGVGGFRTGWKRCVGCHSEEGEGTAVVGEDAVLHGPVGEGRCRPCHDPHDSEYPHLLLDESVEALCRGCHTELPPRTGSMADLDCAVCHDPHQGASEADLFLRGGRKKSCSRCHVLREQELPWLHGPVSSDDCRECHDAHGREGSDRHVRRPVSGVCLRCHEPETLSAKGPCRNSGECDRCHDPHAARSPDDLFLRARIAETQAGGSAFRTVPPPGSDGDEKPSTR